MPPVLLSVTVVAPTSQASRGVLKDEGFDKVETVAQLLADKKMQDRLKNQVLWVDEAGLLGTRDMSGLIDLAHRQNARLILGGDTRQHASVARGDALRILNTVGGIKSAEVSKIYRQKGEAYRSIVEDLSRGNVAQAFQKLDDAGAIKEIDPLGPNTQLIDDYAETIRSGKSALVISPTHEQGHEITKSIRQNLQESGHLGKKQVEAKQFVVLNLTTAQKADWRNLQQGHIVQFNQNRAGIGRGSIWTITSSTDHNVFIRKEGDDEIIPLPTEHSDSYDIYRESKIALAKGDLIRITRNGFDNQKKRLNNGQILQVSSVRKSGAIALHNPVSKAAYRLDQNFGHLAHAYCVTSHSSQGRTTDEVFLHQPSATFGATDAKQIYVSVSRGRERIRIYTDYKDALLEHAKKISDRKSAIELIVGAREAAMQHVREQMEKRPLQKEKEPIDIHKPIRVTKTKDHEPRI
ncbi:AAA family ATPase [Dyadobacter sp. CY261]|nr:AAA family ATPase [Dyadobacter sp. CY261]